MTFLHDQGARGIKNYSSIQLEEVKSMRVTGYLSTTVQPELDAALRAYAIENKMPLARVLRTCLALGLERLGVEIMADLEPLRKGPASASLTKGNHEHG